MWFLFSFDVCRSLSVLSYSHVWSPFLFLIPASPLSSFGLFLLPCSFVAVFFRASSLLLFLLVARRVSWSGL